MHRLHRHADKTLTQTDTHKSVNKTNVGLDTQRWRCPSSVVIAETDVSVLSFHMQGSGAHTSLLNLIRVWIFHSWGKLIALLCRVVLNSS